MSAYGASLKYSTQWVSCDDLPSHGTLVRLAQHTIDSDQNALVIDTTDTHQMPANVPLTPTLSTSATYQFLHDDHLLQSIEISTQEFLEQYNHAAFFDSQLDFMDVLH